MEVLKPVGGAEHAALVCVSAAGFEFVVEGDDRVTAMEEGREAGSGSKKGLVGVVPNDLEDARLVFKVRIVVFSSPAVLSHTTDC